MAEARVVCRAFRNLGSCRFSECKYEHSTGEPIIPPPRPPRFPTQPCERMANEGACRFGRLCHYYHDEADKQRVIPEICMKYRKGECRYGKDCPRQHIPVMDEEKRDTECLTWMRTGECKASEGRLCIYKHSASSKNTGVDLAGAGSSNGDKAGKRKRRGRGKATGASAEQHESKSAPAPAGEKADGEHRRRRKRGARAPRENGDTGASGGRGGASQGGASGPGLCFNFRDQGSCTYGDECRYKHGDGDHRDFSVRRVRKINEICFSYRDGQECSFGANCKYQHDANAPNGTSK